MGGWLWMLVWACLASSGSSDGKERQEESDYESLEYDPYHLDANYLAMKKATSGITVRNLDMLLIYALEVAGGLHTHSESSKILRYDEGAHEALRTWLLVRSGRCVPPRKDQRKALPHVNCLTPALARRLFVKETALTIHLARIEIMEANTRTRLQWFKENGMEDILIFINNHVEKLVREFLSVLFTPISIIMSSLKKFTHLLLERYDGVTEGGSTTAFVRSVDAIAIGYYSLTGALDPKEYNKTLNFYKVTKEKLQMYGEMFERNFKDIKNSPLSYDRSPYRIINRYWNANAMEYAVALIFRFRNSFTEDSSAITTVLKDLHTMLIAGETTRALDLALHTLSKTVDTKGHKLLRTLEAAQLPIDYFPFLGIGMPSTLQEVNVLNFPEALHETDEMFVEKILDRYIWV